MNKAQKQLAITMIYALVVASVVMCVFALVIGFVFGLL